MKQIQINIRLFGAFRGDSDGSELSVQVPEGSSVDELKKHLAELLHSQSGRLDLKELLDKSVFANTERMLSGSEILKNQTKIAVLPPVCGG